MIGPHVALVVMVLYLLLLFGIAQYADHQKHLGRSIVANPYVYALSLCVYVSAWTFYGSIGKAASTGLEFLPIYLGPVLAMTIGWIVIRKMIRVSKEFGLTSVSDFISFRYGSSYTIGAVVAVLQSDHGNSLRGFAAHSHIHISRYLERAAIITGIFGREQAACGPAPWSICGYFRRPPSRSYGTP